MFGVVSAMIGLVMSRHSLGKNLVSVSWLAIVVCWGRAQKRSAISKEVYSTSTALALQVLRRNLLVEGPRILVLIICASLSTSAIMFRVSSTGDSVAGRVFQLGQRLARKCVSPVMCNLSASGPQVALGSSSVFSDTHSNC